MKASFLRKRKMARGVLVLDPGLASLEPHLRRKNFRIITLSVGVVDAERKALLLPHRTLITRTPQEFDARRACFGIFAHRRYWGDVGRCDFGGRH